MRVTLKAKVIGIFFVVLALIVLCQAGVYLLMLGSLNGMKEFYSSIMQRSEAGYIEHLFYHKMLTADDYLLFPDKSRKDLVAYADSAFTAKLDKLTNHPDGAPEKNGALDELLRLDRLHSAGLDRLTMGRGDGPVPNAGTMGMDHIEALEKEILAGIAEEAPGEDAARPEGGRGGAWFGPAGRLVKAIVPAMEGVLDLRIRTRELLDYQAILNVSMLKKNACRRFLITGNERYAREFGELDKDLGRRVDALLQEVAEGFSQEAQSLKYVRESNGVIRAAFDRAVRQYRSGERKEAAATVMGAYLSEEMLDSTATDLLENEKILFNSAYSSLGPMMKYSVLFTRTLLVYLLSVVGFLALLVYEAVTRMSRPIVSLSEASRRIAQGDWTQRVEVRTKDEIGIMAESFNSMADQLEKAQEDLLKRHAELSALYDASVAVNQTLEMDKLLGEVLKAVTGLEMFDLEKRGSIFIVEGDEMKRIACIGTAPCPDENRTGECLCGLAAKTREIVISSDSVSDERHIFKKPGTDSHGHVVVPLNAMDSVVGVLCLYTRSCLGMDETRKKLLYILGGQIGTAISHAKLYEETKALSLKDSLTGLANRRMLDILLGKSFERARRLGSPFSVIMLDIDHFKKYNDTFGHPAGDALLAKIAGILVSEVREIDLAVRYGGEEFFVLLPDAALSEARAVAERLRARVQANSPVTLSLGVSAYRPGTATKEDVVLQADEALYRAKRDGRNRVEVSAPVPVRPSPGTGP